VELIEQVGVVLAGAAEFSLQLLIAESGGLDVLIDYLLHLHDLLHHSLHLHWPLDVHWLHPHFPLHPPRRLQLPAQRLHLQLELGDASPAGRVRLGHVLRILASSQHQRLRLLPALLQPRLQLLHLLALGSQAVLQLLNLRSDDLESFLKLPHAVSEMLILSLFLVDFCLVLFGYAFLLRR
jgi:hypothetical protein